MAQRSVTSTLKNEGKHDLILESTTLDHGIWSAAGQPPARIAQGAEGRWGSESNGFMTGTEGTAIYAVDGTGAKLTVYWDNPFVGDNTFTQSLAQPPANQGSGVPDYVPFDPMRPNYAKTPQEPVQFESGSDISIKYRFQELEQQADEPATPAAPAATQDPSEARVAAAPPDTPTTVKAPAPPRRVIYIGLTDPSAAHEEKSLSKQVGAGGMLSITPTSHGWVMKDKDFEARTSTIPADRREKLKALEAATDALEWSYPNEAYVEKLAKDLRLYTLRALAATFAQCDPELNPSADTSFTKRMCISGHHCYKFTNQRNDIFWGAPGHAKPRLVLTLFNGNGNSSVLAGLADIFPKAFGNVEDLFLSACNTGWETDEIGPGFFKVFKGLKTVWAYEGLSPPPADSSLSNDAVGKYTSTYAINRWELASRPAGAAEDIKKACAEARTKGAGPVVMWIDGKYSK